MAPWLREPRTSRSTDRPKRPSSLDWVAVLGVRLDAAQLPDPLTRLGRVVIDALLEMPRIARMKAGYGMERRERGVALGGERPAPR